MKKSIVIIQQTKEMEPKLHSFEKNKTKDRKNHSFFLNMNNDVLSQKKRCLSFKEIVNYSLSYNVIIYIRLIYCLYNIIISY